ncbi:unnamed protein product [Ambrosiozyma monospora]|uniref:Unnamed protein product n=1 Tax=Ambrosiozyma monospora TaxID=43982 RepID=A0A9W6Z890_AMBMO|nr:unnamed protein product [Ambrosiozyma monospora]
MSFTNIFSKSSESSNDEKQAGVEIVTKSTSNETYQNQDKLEKFGGNDENIVVHELDQETKASSIFGEERARLKQGLEQRHIQMLALVGVFGTGIFLSSGGVLYTTGPAGMFIAYLIMAVITGLNQIALAEVASLMPATSATVRHLEHFVDEAFGFAYGWISVWGNIMPGEISAAAVIVSYWTDLSPAIWISIIIVIIVASNSYSVRFYGEIEFVFAMIKITLLVGLILVSLVITCGGGPDHTTIGFRYWKEQAFKEYIFKGNKGKFVAFWKTISGVVYSYGGLNFAPALAAEVKFPRRTIFRAFHQVTLNHHLLSLPLPTLVSKCYHQSSMLLC